MAQLDQYSGADLGDSIWEINSPITIINNLKTTLKQDFGPRIKKNEKLVLRQKHYKNVGTKKQQGSLFKFLRNWN